MPAATITLQNGLGLHARPASLFVAEAMKHPCRITVDYEGRTADAKSILSVLALGVKRGGTMTVTTDGPDALEALQDLIALIQSLTEGS